MKIAHLTTVDSSLRYLLAAQLEGALTAGHDVVAISAAGPDVAALRRRGIVHRPLPGSTRSMRPLADLRAAIELWRILRQERPDVLHTHNPKPGLYGRVVGRLAGVPVVVNTVHGLYAAPDDAPAKRLAVYTAEAVAARFSDAELVQNPEDLALITRWRLAPKGHARYLGNGVALTRFDPGRFTTEGRRAFRRQLDLSDDSIVVGFVGRLVEEKGLLELFEAGRRLDARFVVLVIGPDDPAKADRVTGDQLARAKETGIRLLGHRDDLERLYAAMDLFVLPSHREGFPRAAMEAAATGLPIVATDVRGCRQVVEQESNGLLVPVGDPEALARAIRRLGDEPATRIRMGAASRALAEARFDERRVVEIVLDTYRAACDARASRRLCKDSRRGAGAGAHLDQGARPGRSRESRPCG